MTDLEIEAQKGNMAEEVLAGLTSLQKTLPSKYFYDKKGSEIFDKITELEEYYPTRVERHILETYVHEMATVIGETVELIEPGSGSSDKTRILLQNMSNICCYIPMDISGDYLFKVADQLQKDFPKIKIVPLQADYTQTFELPLTNPKARKVVFFPGSTIGNFKKERVNLFLEMISKLVGNDGALLIGVDLKKDITVLEAAYNDKKGVTAAFNKNILVHINNELNTNFNLDLFEHRAIWNEEASRIEMHLFVKESHSVLFAGREIQFRKGETIHTENSHKYTLSGFAEMVSNWFEVKKVWTDEQDYFSVQYLEPK
ncbi:MAG: L-histidine N(alpha)-methyltransferase [Balneolaceae bacterium]